MARERNVELVELESRPTAKNRPAYEFVSRINGEARPAAGGATVFSVATDDAVVAQVADLPASNNESRADAGQAPGTRTPSVTGSFLAQIPNEFRTVDQISAALRLELAKQRSADAPFASAENEVEAK